MHVEVSERVGTHLQMRALKHSPDFTGPFVSVGKRTHGIAIFLRDKILHLVCLSRDSVNNHLISDLSLFSFMEILYDIICMN